MSDTGKIAGSGAHQRPQPPSISKEPAERVAGERDFSAANAGREFAKASTPGNTGKPTGAGKPYEGENKLDLANESESASETMGISVAFEGDARQAAAVRLAEEHSLIRKAQAGDRVAFEDLVRRYDRDVLRLAVNLVHRAEDARDIYQESFLRVYRNLHRFRFECSFYTWLYRIVTNAALDHLRRRTSRREDQAPAIDDAEGSAHDFFDRQPAPAAEANPERNLLGRELGQHIEAAMKRLSSRERVVFEMKHYHGMKLRAIGDFLGTSEETVKNSLFRATRKLRASLDCMR
jgi:RNA polymerase sigma-70 factor (ECF subfamily)